LIQKFFDMLIHFCLLGGEMTVLRN
jgi:hypothetical protein